MRIVHLLQWPQPGAAHAHGASAAAHVAAAAVARRPDLEHLVYVLGPSSARRWAAGAGLPGPVLQIAPPVQAAAMAAPALGRALRAAAPDLIQAWSPAAGAVARRVRPPGARVCAAALATGPLPRRWMRAAPTIDALVTPCGRTAREAGRVRAAARIIETAPPAPALDQSDPAPAPEARAALRAQLELRPDDRVVLLVGDGGGAMRFVVACALTGASGRRLCALLPEAAGSARRALRTVARSRTVLDCRIGRAPWTHLAAAADIGMIVEDGDIAVAAALSAAMSLGLPVIAPAPVYQRLGVQRQHAPELVGAAWTRAELARLAGPLMDEPQLARRALGQAHAAAARAAGAPTAGRDFFDALDEAWQSSPPVAQAALAHTIPA